MVMLAELVVMQYRPEAETVKHWCQQLYSIAYIIIGRLTLHCVVTWLAFLSDALHLRRCLHPQ